MLLSNLVEENHISVTTAASADGTDQDKTKSTNKVTMRKFTKDKKMVRRHLLNHMNNPLFHLFVIFKFSKIIEEKLEATYEVDNARKKKYVVGKWLRL